MPILPEGTVTFLLTDIEESTRLWEEQPDAMADALVRHDALAAEYIAAHDGVLVKSRGEGDSLFCVFERATNAVRAAIALQSAFCAEPWKTTRPLRVRFALHTGDAQMRDSDYYGGTVNRCARLRGIAHGGQILLSEATAGFAAAETLPVGASLKDLGEHRLRDLQRPERVFQVQASGLPQTFPTLRSLTLLRHNLPIQMTSFIGREREIADVRGRLEETHLLTITGAGGVGKTRLALQVGAEAMQGDGDGVWLVELASLTDPDLVPQAVAQVFRVAEEPGKPLLESLLAFLSGKRMLLLLDNCEHLLSACARFADTVLRRCPNVHLLVSSREPLGIAGESVFRLPSLAFPDETKLPAPDELREYEAVRLFSDRASAALPTFAVTERNAAALVSICRQLDGIPLALELAAARVRVLTVEQIAARLNDRFRLLTGGSRTALPRQQTLRAMIDWSYDLLTGAERALLLRLSVFTGGWTLDAAEQVCADTETEDDAEQHGLSVRLDVLDILDLLTALVDKSLVVCEEGDTVRYRLLETIRQYANERVLVSEDAAVLRDRHSACYLTFIEAIVLQLQGKTHADTIAQIATEYDNLRAALHWSLAAPKDSEQTAARLIVALQGFWYARSSFTEGAQWLDRLLSRPSAETPPLLTAKALNAAVSMHWRLGNYSKAQTYLDDLLPLCRVLGDEELQGAALNNQANLLYYQGYYAESRPFYEEALALARVSGNPRRISITLNNLGLVESDLDNYSTARMHFLESLELRRATGDRMGMANVQSNLAEVLLRAGDPAEARRLVEEAYATRSDLQDKFGLSYSLQTRAELAIYDCDFPQARLLLAESLMLKQEIGEKWGLIAILHMAAEIALQEKDAHMTCLLLGAAEARRIALGAALPPREVARATRMQEDAAALCGRQACEQSLILGRAMPSEEAMETVERWLRASV